MIKQAYVRIQELDKLAEEAELSTFNAIAIGLKGLIALVVAVNELTQAVDDVARAVRSRP